ncbi:MAG: hypothetical protein C5B52_07030 [Bacteroidetes bacterium]|nr:MAG: hypothetical protein C5B52_07030 [Bacteroidota bacterium]
MKKHHLPLMIVICLFACKSPGPRKSSEINFKNKDSANVQVSAKSDSPPNYKPYILEEPSIPPYGLDSVKALIRKITWEDDSSGDGGVEAIDVRVYKSLPIKLKFTYNMIHPESYSQMCDILPSREHEENRIYGELTDNFGEYDWSDRQIDFFKENRDSVENLMKETIEKDNIIGSNFKEAIVAINGKEMIPFLINFYNKEKKDHYILTMLMLLMKNNNYAEFMNSISYKKLYDGNEDSYSKYLIHNKANEELIIQRATNYYNGLQTK